MSGLIYQGPGIWLLDSMHEILRKTTESPIHTVYGHAWGAEEAGDICSTHHGRKSRVRHFKSVFCCSSPSPSPLWQPIRGLPMPNDGAGGKVRLVPLASPSFDCSVCVSRIASVPSRILVLISPPLHPLPSTGVFVHLCLPS